MKNWMLLLVGTLFFLPVQKVQAIGSVGTTNSALSVTTQKVSTKKTSTYRQLKQLREQQLGRKLRFSERVGLRALTLLGEPDPLAQKRANSNALLGFIFGLSSLFLVGLLAIPGLILSNQALRAERLNPGILQGDRLGFAQAGKIMSIVTLALLALVLLLFIAILGIGFAAV